MKKRILSLSVLALFAGSLVFTGCKKEEAADVTAPSITVKGDNPMTITTGATFTDPGASANDEKDGDLSSSIVASGTVDNDMAGEYTISYNVSDAAGNAAEEKDRTVYVQHNNSTLNGTYNVTESCTDSQGNPFSPTPYSGAVVSGAASETAIAFTNFGNFNVSITVNGAISGNTGMVITIPSANYSGTVIESTASSVNAAGTVLTINYTSTAGSNTDQCTATWTKQ